jgi:hypothetical protein
MILKIFVAVNPCAGAVAVLNDGVTFDMSFLNPFNVEIASKTGSSLT